MTPAACSSRIAPESPASAIRHGKIARPLMVEHRRAGSDRSESVCRRPNVVRTEALRSHSKGFGATTR
jgi:hypothetical protein